MLKTGMIIAERYEIVSKIGTGGMADVYKAMDHKLFIGTYLRIISGLELSVPHMILFCIKFPCRRISI